MEKLNKGNILLVIIIIIIGVVFISGGLYFYFTREVEEGTVGLSLCSWVFKTDPTNIGHLDATLDIERDEIIAGSISPPSLVGLNGGYFAWTDTCNYEEYPQRIVFLKATDREEFLSVRKEKDNVQDLIKDHNPFERLYFCDQRLGEEGIEYINEFIDNDKLNEECEKIL